MNNENYLQTPAKALQKMNEIFQLIASSRIGQTLTELHIDTKQPKTSIHRTLQTLEQAGWIEAQRDNARIVIWFVSAKFIKHAFQWRRKVLGETTQPIIGDMSLNHRFSNKKDVAAKGISIFNLVVKAGIEGAALDNLYLDASESRTTTYRILKSWESLGWLQSVVLTARREKWVASSKFVDIAHEYENQRRQEIHRICEEFEEITGETL